MPLPASVPTGTVSGTWYTPSGNLAVGKIIFLLTHEIEIPDDADGVVIPVRHEVTVSAGQLNATLPAGFYNTLVRLAELYYEPKTIEIKANQNLNLPDAIGVVPPEQLVTPVRSVNGEFPDASGNIEISGGGGGAVDSVFGRTGAVVAQSGDYTKAQVGLSNVDNTSDANKPVSTATQTALDGKANTVHSHVISDVTGLQTALDGKEASGTASSAISAHVAASDPHPQYALDSSLASVALSGSYNDLSNKPVIGPEKYATTGQFVGNNFGPCGVSGTWTVCPAAFRVTIAASAGDILIWNISAILGITATSDAEFDLAAVDGSGNILRAKSSNTNTPLANGDGGMYCWQNNSRRLPSQQWQVQAGDIVSGNVTLALLYRASGSGLSVGHATVYPSSVSVTNLGTPQS